MDKTSMMFTVVLVISIVAIVLISDSSIQASIAVSHTPVTTNTTNTNTTEVNITTVTVTSYTTTTVTSYIFQTYTSIQVVTLSWGIDPNLTILSVIVVGVVALAIGYVIGYKTRREEALVKPGVEKPVTKPKKRR